MKTDTLSSTKPETHVHVPKFSNTKDTGAFIWKIASGILLVLLVIMAIVAITTLIPVKLPAVWAIAILCTVIGFAAGAAWAFATLKRWK